MWQEVSQDSIVSGWQLVCKALVSLNSNSLCRTTPLSAFYSLIAVYFQMHHSVGEGLVRWRVGNVAASDIWKVY